MSERYCNGCGVVESEHLLNREGDPVYEEVDGTLGPCGEWAVDVARAQAAQAHLVVCDNSGGVGRLVCAYLDRAAAEAFIVRANTWLNKLKLKSLRGSCAAGTTASAVLMANGAPTWDLKLGVDHRGAEYRLLPGIPLVAADKDG